MSSDDLIKKITQWSENNDTDFLYLSGDIKRPLGDQLINECRNRALKRNVFLLLNTYGGNPDEAYRIAKCLQIAYKSKGNNQSGKFTVGIANYCKSAGTLICIGANELMMTGKAQIGPTDIQISRPDEIGEQ